MKKLLGVLALVLSVSSLAMADQDTVKEIHFSSELRQSYTDKKTNTGNGLGIAGFKGQNKEQTKWRNVLGGDLNLVDEGNLGLRFEFQNDQNRVKNDFDYQNKKLVTNGVYDKSQTWENDIALYKDVKLGSWTSKWDLGWKYKSTNGNGRYAGHRGTSNEIYVGPEFGIDFFGHHFDGKAQFVYFDQSGEKDGDNAWSGSDFINGKTSGVGGNFDLATNGKVFDNKAGNLNYYVTLNNHLRDAKGKLVATGKDAQTGGICPHCGGSGYKGRVGIYELMDYTDDIKTLILDGKSAFEI